MFKKTILTVILLATTIIFTGCGKSNAPQTNETAEKAPEVAKEAESSVKGYEKGIDEYNDVIEYLKSAYAKKGVYPKDFDDFEVGNRTYPYTYMVFNDHDMIFRVEISDKIRANYCSNTEMEGCNPEAKEDGVTYSKYKNWVIVKK